MLEDYYAILGILSDAEDVVVVAAYRALAQRYHPDKWSGNVDAAHLPMAKINEAYDVLGNKTRRAEYDKVQKDVNRSSFSSNEEACSQAFESALDDLEDRWNIACSVFPGLDGIRKRLNRTSVSLAFAFATTILENKAFARRDELALHLETMFLTRYFGTNSNVLEFAKMLIAEGQRDALKALNRLVEVVGSDADHQLVLARIENDFGISQLLANRKSENERVLRIENLKKQVKHFPDFYGSKILAELLGYDVESIDQGLFRGWSVIVTAPDHTTLSFTGHAAFKNWASENLTS